MDWEGALITVHELESTPAAPDQGMILAAPVGVDDEEAEVRTQQKAGRSPVPDELYLVRLRQLVDEAGGAVPSIREVARRLSIGQDRARRLVAAVSVAQVHVDVSSAEG